MGRDDAERQVNDLQLQLSKAKVKSKELLARSEAEKKVTHYKSLASPILTWARLSFSINVRIGVFLFLQYARHDIKQ